MKYLIPFLNGGVEINPTEIEMTGEAGAPLLNDVSPGGFYVDLVLTFGTSKQAMVSVRVASSTSQPTDTTSLESIKEWAIAQLDVQYGQE